VKPRVSIPSISPQTKPCADKPLARTRVSQAIKLRKEKLVVYLEDETLSSGMEMHLGILQKLRRSSFEAEEAFHEALARARLLESYRSAE
jgi:hypothetical protein